MKRLFFLCGLFVLAGAATPAVASDDGRPDAPCYWCVRDAIYADTSLIGRLEANPDLDEGLKGPPIVAARADIHHLRQLLGPPEQTGSEPCCYSRKRLYVR
jgi:hypothetical protein